MKAKKKAKGPEEGRVYHFFDLKYKKRIIPVVVDSPEAGVITQELTDELLEHVRKVEADPAYGLQRRRT